MFKVNNKDQNDAIACVTPIFESRDEYLYLTLIGQSQYFYVSQKS